MAGRPKKDDSRERQYRVRLNDAEEEKLNFASEATGKKKSEIFRLALLDYYQKVRLQQIAFESADEEYLDDGTISLKRVVSCPYCDASNMIDLEDECSISTDDRQMGPERLYEFSDAEFECDTCNKTFLVSGYVSEYPMGALNAEDIKVFPSTEED